MTMFMYNSRKFAEAEVDKRRAQSRTYTEPLQDDLPNVKIFLEEFYDKDIFERGQEFKAELEKYPDSVAEHYKFLVPEQVSFDQFFSRYYYRCNVQNVMRECTAQLNDEYPRRGSLGRTKSETIDQSMFRNMIPASPSPNSTRRIVSKRPTPMRAQSNRLPPSPLTNTRADSIFRPTNGTTSFFTMKEKPKELVTADEHREARNEMALKLLQEAKGRPIESHTERTTSLFQMRF